MAVPLLRLSSEQGQGCIVLVTLRALHVAATVTACACVHLQVASNPLNFSECLAGCRIAPARDLAVHTQHGTIACDASAGSLEDPGSGPHTMMCPCCVLLVAGKPCMISNPQFPLESVFLGSTDSTFATAVMAAQKGCTTTASEKGCNANTTSLDSNVLQAAMDYSASTTASTAPSSPAPGAAVKPDLTASWGLPGIIPASFQAHLPAADQEDHALATGGNAQPTTGSNTPPPAASTNTEEQPPAPPALALPALPPLPKLAGMSCAGASGSTVVQASASASATSGLPLAADSLKKPGTLLKPIKSSEWMSDVFGAAEATYTPGQANYPGTKKALGSLRILLRLPRP